MQKLDLRKQLKQLYQPPTKNVVEVDVPAMTFLMLDGKGDPNTSMEYQRALETLYGLAYTLKFASKAKGIDFQVMPLEGLWWMEEMGEQYDDFDFAADKSKWLWTMMIMQPEHIGRADLDAAVETMRAKKDLPDLARVRLERFEEGRAAQTMHLGPYSAEKPTIDQVHAFIQEQGCEPSGKHHEIYVGDPRRSAPEKLRTVVRQPMRGRGA